MVAVIVLPAHIIFACIHQIVHVSAHCIQVFPDDFRVSILLIQLPHEDYPRVTPAVCPAVHVVARRNLRESAVFALPAYQHFRVVLQIIICIEIVHRRIGKHLCVARPPEAFVPLGTVRRHIQVIAHLRPANAVIQPVYLVVRTGKSACPPDVRTNHKPAHIRQRQRFSKPRYLHIAKAPAHKGRRVSLLPGAAHDIIVRVVRGIQVLCPDRPDHVIAARHPLVV